MCRDGVIRQLALVASFALVSVAAAWAGTEHPASSRLVDRTLVCRMPGVGHPDPSRFMTFSAVNGRSAIVSASNGPDYELRATVATGPIGRERSGYVALNRETCIGTKPPLPLSTRRLSGGAVAGFGKTFECDVPTRVLVRVQATFKRPTGFAPDRDAPTLIRARGGILAASIAIASLDRTPIALASADGKTGKTRIYVAPSRCARTR
jgi:hypothetical protein